MTRCDVLILSGFLPLPYCFSYYPAILLQINFSKFSFFGVKYTDAKIQISLWQFALLAMFLLFTSVLSQSDWFKDQISSLKPNIRYLTGTFVIALIVYYLIAVSELFILDGKLVVNIEEAMNFGVSEFFFYGLSLGHLFMWFIWPNDCSQKQKPLPKDGKKFIHFRCHTFSDNLFYFFGFTTNTIGIVLFLMVLFLLLDLYFEYFEINVSFY
ncbi:MAG: hypothetical protein IPH94_06875 [Saprospiraceae bacterium]|nr:hypothetical protein [Saprospiraceae bacterium]